MQACWQLHTKAKFLSRKLPFGVIWQLCGVNIYVVVAMDTFNHLPLYLELGFLFEKKEKRYLGKEIRIVFSHHFSIHFFKLVLYLSASVLTITRSPC